MTILKGDCLDVMPTMEANSVDCVVTDPPYGLSFMGKDWDKGIPGVAFWEAAYRVMKPGSFLLSFGGTRTFHRLTCAIEDAGFEIRDCMMWLYGSGFPKSHDVSKAIDKAAGAEREVVGKYPSFRPNSEEHENGKYAGELHTNGNITAPATVAARQWSGWGTALKPAWEPIIVARKPLEGTVAENVLKWGTGGMNIDGGRIATHDKIETHAHSSDAASRCYGGSLGEVKTSQSEAQKLGRWPANVILDEEAGAMLDGQSGISKSSGGWMKDFAASNLFQGKTSKNKTDSCGLGDTGGASRFFYCAKTSKKERGEGNNHPTVKPVSLLQYLIKLVCPPNGTVLDPFAGSGSTLVAASRLGFKSIGIELEETYCEIARKRVEAEMLPLEMAIA